MKVTPEQRRRCNAALLDWLLKTGCKDLEGVKFSQLVHDWFLARERLNEPINFSILRVEPDWELWEHYFEKYLG